MHAQAQEEFRLSLAKSFTAVRLLLTHECITSLHVPHNCGSLKHDIAHVVKLRTGVQGTPKSFEAELCKHANAVNLQAGSFSRYAVSFHVPRSQSVFMTPSYAHHEVSVQSA